MARKLLHYLFDIRCIIGSLLGIYGALLTVAGFVPALLGPHRDPAATGNRLDMYVGTDANWWVGLVLLGIAATFFIWAVLRPMPAAATDTSE
ncbi:hypothetical protein ABIA30_002465 [Mycobacterium sp. MAA66]|jgi:hypothetical protein|uniref:hypothetical protein n=1 Tax=Mycobacterium sp. MAA66 TaxID=3156297 RepID=UPI003517C40D